MLRVLPRLLPLLLPIACGEPQPPVQQAQPVQRHDYGEIPHGEKRTHEFWFEIPPGLDRPVPLAFHGDCTCAEGAIAVVGKDGQRRQLSGPPGPQHALQPGERVVLALTLDSARKEPVDLPKITSTGRLIFGEAGATNRRAEVPVQFFFAIKAPILVRPRAHVDLGELPRSRTYAQTLELVPAGGKAVRFGPVYCSDPQVRGTLRREGNLDVLDLVVSPAAAGGDAQPIAAEVAIDTDLPNHYQLRIKVTGTLVPDVQVQPFATLAFGRIDFTQPAEQFVNLVDHDLRRDPGFVLESLTDEHGVDQRARFAVRFEPIVGDPRATRLFVAYRGGLTGRVFRGTIVLAKQHADGPKTTIQVLAYNTQGP